MTEITPNPPYGLQTVQPKAKIIDFRVPSWEPEEGMAWDWLDKQDFSSESYNFQIRPVWFYIDEEGRLGSYLSYNDLIIRTRWAQDKGIAVIPSIHNWDERLFDFDPQRVNLILENQKTQEEFFRSVNKYSGDFDGWEIDFESMTAKPDRFTKFVSRFYQSLSEDKSLTVAVHAKLPNDSWPGNIAQDFGSLSKYTDYLRVIAYAHCWENGCDFGHPPGPISPYPWIKDVLDYASKEVESDKILVGINLYGIDWTLDGKNGQELPWFMIDALIQKYQPLVQWDEVSQEPFFNYDNHQVWFANQDSIIVRCNLALTFAGVSFWYIGGHPNGIEKCWGK